MDKLSINEEMFAELEAWHEKGHVIGLRDATGGVGYRLDIDVLMKTEPETFNLFLLAFKKLQEMDWKKPMSYYQMAGIHGFPKTPWDGVEGKLDMPDFDWGYCEHKSALFPTWHRPYLAMLEQALFVTMVNIAKDYKDQTVRDAYLKAAAKFRLPYWDYWRPRDGAVKFSGVVDKGEDTVFPYDYRMPFIFTEEEIKVRTTPDNELVSIKNPLQRFNVPEDPGFKWDYIDEGREDMKDLGYLEHKHTHRHPWPPNRDMKLDDVKRLNMTMNELRMDMNRIMLNLVMDEGYAVYETFASAFLPKGVRKIPKDQEGDDHKERKNTTWGYAAASLEALHNIYHGMIGGIQVGGWHSRVATAAFDPVFWFHHNNIERILCIWQGTNAGKGQDSWLKDDRQQNENLLPFRAGPSTEGRQYWNSNMCKDSAVFGYTFEDAEGTREEIIERLEKKYRWSVPLYQLPAWFCPDDMKPLDLTKCEVFDGKTWMKPPQTQTEVLVKDLSSNLLQELEKGSQTSAMTTSAFSAQSGDVYEWYIDDSVDAMALNGSFSIMYFINNEANVSLQDENVDYTLAPTLAGMSYIFTDGQATCSACRVHAQERLRVSNTVPITSLLLDYVKIGKLESLEVKPVKQFLAERLRWRVVKINGQTVDARDLARDHHLDIGLSYKRRRVTDDNSDAWFIEPDYGRADDVIQDIIDTASQVSRTESLALQMAGIGMQ